MIHFLLIPFFHKVLPHIRESFHIRRPGDCNDVTHQNIVSEHVGMNLCCSTSTILYLHCVVDRGNPKPEITWFKDGSSVPKPVQVLYNGTTLLFQNTTIDLQAELDNHPAIGGNYTCIAKNPAGTVAASSIITLVGGKTHNHIIVFFKSHALFTMSQTYPRKS